MKKIFLLTTLATWCSMSSWTQEPKANYFDDFVFKSPVAYTTPYTNEDMRITHIADIDGYTVISLSDKVRIIADSAWIAQDPNIRLIDPATNKEYNLIYTGYIPKFERIKYLKGRPEPYTLKYSLFFNRIPKDVKTVNFNINVDRETRDEIYEGCLFANIDISNRPDLTDDDVFYIDTAPECEIVTGEGMIPVTVTRGHIKESEKDRVKINMVYSNPNADSKYGSIYINLPPGMRLIDVKTGKKYSLHSSTGLNPKGDTIIRGYNVMGFNLNFHNVDPEVEIVNIECDAGPIVRNLRIK